MPDVDLAACPDRGTLERLLRGLLDEDAIERLDEHLSQCEGCCRAARSLHLNDELVDAVRGAVEIDELPSDHDVRELIDRLKTLRLRPRSPADTTAKLDNLTKRDAWGLENLLDPPQAAGEVGRLAGYRVLGVLGAGGMGLVLSAEDPRLGRRVAIKVMDGRLAASEEYRRRFLHEARAAAAIEHPHVVAVHQVGEHRGFPFLAMQLLEGESLEDRLERQCRLPLEDCLRIGQEIAQALSAAHRRGLVHRDIKPANIWLQSPGDVIKLLDFGLARAEGLTRMTHTGLVLGTPTYMSPEQARGEAAEPAADLFSLGAVLYRISTGQEPFGGSSTLAVLTALAIARPAPPHALNPTIPRRFSDLVLRLLAKRPAERPPSAAAVAAALVAIDRAERKPRPAAGRRRLPSWLIAAGAVLLLGLVAALAALRGRDPSQTISAESAVERGASRPAPQGPGLPDPTDDQPGPPLTGEENVAAWVLRAGGSVDGHRSPDHLADVRYPIHSIALENAAVGDATLEQLLACPCLEGIRLGNTGTTGAGLRFLSQLSDLHVLDLSNSPRIADAEIKQIARIRSLFTLNLDATRVTAAGLDRLAALPRLASLSVRGIASGLPSAAAQPGASHNRGFLCLNELDLSGAAIGDDDLWALAGMSGLLSLNLTATRVSEAAITQLQQVLPDCWIVGADGRTHAPPPRPGDPDRRAAERFIELGYQVHVANPRQQMASALSELPPDDFRLVWVGPGPATCTDADLQLLAPCRQLSVVHLWGSAAVTPAGVAHLRGLTKLAHLNLSGLPQLTDAVPPMLADLPSLRTVGFRGAPITDAGLRRWPHLSDLEYLDLGSTRVTGASLECLSHVPRLRQLVLAGIRLDDADLEPLHVLTGLQELDLADTTTSGAALQHLKPLRQLRRLILSRNRLADRDAERLLVFKELQKLVLDGTAMGEPALARLAENLKNLEWLSLIDTSVTGAGLQSLKRLPRLRTLLIGGASASIDDDAIAAVAELPQLESLEVVSSRLTDAGLEHLRKEKRLKSLVLRGTAATKEGIANLKRSLPDCRVTQ